MGKASTKQCTRSTRHSFPACSFCLRIVFLDAARGRRPMPIAPKWLAKISKRASSSQFQEKAPSMHHSKFKKDHEKGSASETRPNENQRHTLLYKPTLRPRKPNKRVRDRAWCLGLLAQFLSPPLNQPEFLSDLLECSRLQRAELNFGLPLSGMFRYVEAWTRSILQVSSADMFV